MTLQIFLESWGDAQVERIIVPISDLHGATVGPPSGETQLAEASVSIMSWLTNAIQQPHPRSLRSDFVIRVCDDCNSTIVRSLIVRLD